MAYYVPVTVLCEFCVFSFNSQNSFMIWDSFILHIRTETQKNHTPPGNREPGLALRHLALGSELLLTLLSLSFWNGGVDVDRQLKPRPSQVFVIIYLSLFLLLWAYDGDWGLLGRHIQKIQIQRRNGISNLILEGCMVQWKVRLMGQTDPRFECCL